MPHGLDRTDFGTGAESDSRATDTLSDGTARSRAYREFYRAPEPSAQRSTTVPEAQDRAHARTLPSGSASVRRDVVGERIEPPAPAGEDILRHARGRRQDAEVHDELATSAQFGHEGDDLTTPSFGHLEGSWAHRGGGWHTDAEFVGRDSHLFEEQGRALSTSVPSNRRNQDHRAQDRLTASAHGAERDRGGTTGDLLALSSPYNSAPGGLNESMFEGQGSPSRDTLDREHTGERHSETALPEVFRAPYPEPDGHAADSIASPRDRDYGSTPLPTDTLASPILLGIRPREHASHQVDGPAAPTAEWYGGGASSEPTSRPGVFTSRQGDSDRPFNRNEISEDPDAQGGAPISGSQPDRSGERSGEAAPRRHRTTPLSPDSPVGDLANSFAAARTQAAPQNRPGTHPPGGTAGLPAIPFEITAPSVPTGRESLVDEQIRPEHDTYKRRRALAVAAWLAIGSVAAGGVSVPAVRHVLQGLVERIQSADSQTAAGSGRNPPSVAPSTDAATQIPPPTPSVNATRQKAVEPDAGRGSTWDASPAPVESPGAVVRDSASPSSAASLTAAPELPAERDGAANPASQAAPASAVGMGEAPQLTSEIAAGVAPISTDLAQTPRSDQLPRMILPAEAAPREAVDHGATAPAPPTRAAGSEVETRASRARRRAANRGRRLSPRLDAANAAAERLLASGQFVAARQAFARAASAGDPRGARGVARTFDERVIGKFDGSGVMTDREKSARWYRTATELESRQEAARTKKSNDSR